MERQNDSITIKNTHNINWKTYLENELRLRNCNQIDIEINELVLKCKDIELIKNLFRDYGHYLKIIRSSNPETIVSCKTMNVKSELILKSNAINILDKVNISKGNREFQETYFHQGTLRSGEVLEINNDLLILGDVNPGAIIKATGSIKVWGRLLGTAHAGKEGDVKGKISALQLRPVQLRIADKIARGPKEKPITGFAEEAKIEEEEIIISPITTF